MRITTKIVYDLALFWERGEWLILEHEFYDLPVASGLPPAEGPGAPWVAWCKGDSTLQAGEQQQLAFNEQLMQIFSQQSQLQGQQLAFLNGILKPMVSNPQGLSPQALSSMRTSASDTITTQAANAKQAVQTEEAAHGGGTGLPSGAEAQIEGQMATATAAQQSTAQNQITQYNEQVRQSNFWNAINGLSGNAAMLNPQSYGQLYNQGGSSLAGLGTAYYNSQQSGWLNAALGGLGAAAGGWASGGFKMP